MSIEIKFRTSLFDTYAAVNLVKVDFTKNLSKKLDLIEILCPLFNCSDSKINDPLSGEQAVKFSLKGVEKSCEIYHSLAKWKRVALKKIGFPARKGIFAHMKAIRSEETITHKHSFFVEQWDWEVVIKEEERTLEVLFEYVKKAYEAIKQTKRSACDSCPQLSYQLPESITFISSQELQSKYPKLSPEEREREFAKKTLAFFVYQIGYKLEDGLPHSSRAFDYDDWKLNGDLIVWHEPSDDALELSSMGVRVDAQTLLEQQKSLNITDSAMGEYHKLIKEKDIPFTIGGGIGVSRMLMYILEKKYIGEVQSSVWTSEILKQASEEGIEFLI